MECVEPIRSKEQINAIKCYLRNHNLRNYLLFVLGINSGLRISDLLSLTIEDVKEVDRIILREKKTGKPKRFPFQIHVRMLFKNILRILKLIVTGCLKAKKK
ncbi:tyrosine-type recombinase/integrase [Sporomusa sphaeroides]|uniref:tyrosine-type recombinase/integrase n=1 Tax=Sporomusa sphaeroides TaxID=47679 RepID=UPI0030D558A8